MTEAVAQAGTDDAQRAGDDHEDMPVILIVILVLMVIGLVLMTITENRSSHHH